MHTQIFCNSFLQQNRLRCFFRLLFKASLSCRSPPKVFASFRCNVFTSKTYAHYWMNRLCQFWNMNKFQYEKAMLHFLFLSFYSNNIIYMLFLYNTQRIAFPSLHFWSSVEFRVFLHTTVRNSSSCAYETINFHVTLILFGRRLCRVAMAIWPVLRSSYSVYWISTGFHDTWRLFCNRLHCIRYFILHSLVFGLVCLCSEWNNDT